MPVVGLDNKFYSYLICTPAGRETYVGATTNPDHRLRQHNGEITGGAKYTTMKVAKGLHWERICYLADIPTWQLTLQIEWKWKNLGSSEFKRIKNPIQRRLMSLKRLLSLERATSKAVPFGELQVPIRIIWEKDTYQKQYDAIVLEPVVIRKKRTKKVKLESISIDTAVTQPVSLAAELVNRFENQPILESSNITRLGQTGV